MVMATPYDPRYNPQYGPVPSAPEPVQQAAYPGYQPPVAQPAYQPPQQQYPSGQQVHPGYQGAPQQYPGTQQQYQGYPGAQPGSYPAAPTPGNQMRAARYAGLRKRGERRTIIGGSLLLFGAILAGIGYLIAGEGVVYYAGYAVGLIGLWWLLRGIRSLVNSKLFPATDAAVDSVFNKLRR
jgi:hypothetical protein